MTGEIISGCLIIAISFVVGCSKIASSLEGKEKDDMQRGLLGRPKKAEVIKKFDNLDEILK